MLNKEKLDIINKKLGSGVIRRYGDADNRDVDLIPTGNPGIDKILGGGLPKGRVVEIYGPEGSGKTTLTLHMLAECQKQGGTVAFVDVEHGLDPNYATNLGVRMDDLLIAQPDSAEQAFEVIEALIHTGEVDLIVLDSIATLSPKAELDTDFGDATVGVNAKMITIALKKFIHPLTVNNCMLLCINQLRDKIGGFGYGPQETTPGGRALKHLASVRMDIRRVGSVKQGEKVIGNKTKIKVIKNRMAAPYQEVEVELVFGQGFSKEGDLLDMAMERGVIEKSGAWFSFNGTKFAQGREKAREALKEEEFFKEVYSKTYGEQNKED